nr:glycoside hydrolase [Clostridiales bacterium]
MKVKLFKRVLVDCAPRRERRWGHWQFPMLYACQGRYVYHFADAADAYDSYGHPGWNYVAETSAMHWTWCQDDAFVMEARSLLLPNGDRILKKNENSARMEELDLPSPVGAFDINHRHYICYPSDLLPPEVGGLLLLRRKAGETEWKRECAVMKETHGIRCGFDGLIPAMQARANKLWMGPDGKVYLLVYNFKMNDDGTPDPRDRVYLMRSDDMARTFEEIGEIPYVTDPVDDPRGMSPDRRGFLEPDMIFLDEKKILCVMRTCHRENGPMYATRSLDGGVTWEKPWVIMNHGVYPHMVH